MRGLDQLHAIVRLLPLGNAVARAGAFPRNHVGRATGKRADPGTEQDRSQYRKQACEDLHRCPPASRTTKLTCRGRCKSVMSRETLMRPRSSSAFGYAGLAARSRRAMNPCTMPDRM